MSAKTVYMVHDQRKASHIRKTQEAKTKARYYHLTEYGELNTDAL